MKRSLPAPAIGKPAAARDGGETSSSERLLYLDNLRSTVILLVVSMHAADTYSPLGNWYFVDRRPLTRLELLFFAAWQMYLQSFFMGLLFFVAGYFVPPSLARKGGERFIRNRFYRLGMPVLFYMFVLGPVTEYFVARSWTSTTQTSFWKEWFKHLRNGAILSESGPLWFCLALLIFTTIYTFISRWASRRSNTTRAHTLRPRHVLAFAVSLAALTFATRLVLPPNFVAFNMHLADFPQYILLFSAGIAASGRCWLPQVNARFAGRWAVIVLPLGLAAWLALLFVGGALQGNTAAYGGGWHWQAAGLDLWESFTCATICLGLVALYREKFNRQGPFARFLSANAFSAYVFHPPILIACARLLHGLPAPPIEKFAILTVLGAALSFALSGAVFRRIPFLRSIL